MSFKLKMEQISRKAGSNIVLALDLPPEKPKKLLFQAKKILEAVHPHVCAVKFNHHLTLPLGLFGDLQDLLNQAKGFGLPTIMDCKINDIGNTNQTIAEYYFEAGFDAVTANPFVGWEDGLCPVFNKAKRMNRGVLLLVYMSHKGASEGYGQKIIGEEGEKPQFQYRIFAERALKWGAAGAVVGSTYPEKIKELNLALKEKVPIYSPGIGIQGGNTEITIKNGATYLIVGRAITQAKNPLRIAIELKRIAHKSAK